MTFRARVDDPSILKLVVDLLSKIVRTGCFVINRKGIHLTMMDSQEKLLVDLSLHGFSELEAPEEDLHIGLSLSELHKILKLVNKKDKIELFMDAEMTPNKLGIKVLEDDGGDSHDTIMHLTTHEAQSINFILPGMREGLSPITVSSSRFQRVFKNMLSLGAKMARISSNNQYIEVCCNFLDISERRDRLGAGVSIDSPSPHLYNEEFSFVQLSRVLKITSLAPTITIIPSDVLILESEIIDAHKTKVGEIKLYVKPIEAST